ncbi:hypothetical protein SDC9_173381 [bioreactor metagenome]|uniref:Uncharacterized protein n=1 Tax=bioreactor metagenome TaxID=1076179 RepID=A0A645GJF7_9ZZZZ
MLVEIAAHVGHGTRWVVGSRLHHDGNAERSVTLIDHLLVVRHILVCCLLDGALHILFGHVLFFCLLLQYPQPGVGGGVGTTLTDGNGNLFSQFGEDAGHIAPTFHLGRFSIFKCPSHIFMNLILGPFCKGSTGLFYINLLFYWHIITLAHY